MLAFDFSDVFQSKENTLRNFDGNIVIKIQIGAVNVVLSFRDLLDNFEHKTRKVQLAHLLLANQVEFLWPFDFKLQIKNGLVFA